MATTENLHNGTGSQDTFAFTFPYLKDTDIKVSVGGILKTVTTHYTLHTPTTIKFTSGNIPASGTSNVRVYRETADTALQATFYPGSAIRSNDLNDNFTQNLYVIQENNNRVDSAWQTGDETIISTEVWHTSDDTRIASTKAIENRIAAQIDTAIEGDVLAGTDLAKTQSGGQVTINHALTGAASVNNSNGSVIQDLTINGRGHVTGTGSVNLDDRYYTETELDNGQLDNRYYTETELLSTGVLDARYYTETEMDANFYKVGSLAEISSGETWVASDTKVATTSAIDARIVDLVDDVGGFVPIENETSFPNTNPDVNNGAGTLISIKALGNNITSNGSGVATISNGTVGNSTVTITGLANSTTYSATFGMIVETTSTLNTYTYHRLTPKATELTTVAGIAGNITIAATNVTDINNFADRYIIHSSAPTVRTDGTALQNGDLWFDSSSNKVMMVYDSSSGDGFSSTSPNQAQLADIAIVSGDLTYTDDLGLITESISTNTNGDITTVADNITKVNTVANNNTNINTVAAANSNIATVAAANSNIATVAGNNPAITTVANNNSNITTVAGNNTNITTVAAADSNINTVATSIADVNRYANEYKIANSAPGSPSAGDLWYDGSNNILK